MSGDHLGFGWRLGESADNRAKDQGGANRQVHFNHDFLFFGT
jgi:hypothetical protein